MFELQRETLWDRKIGLHFSNNRVSHYGKTFSKLLFEAWKVELQRIHSNFVDLQFKVLPITLNTTVFPTRIPFKFGAFYKKLPFFCVYARSALFCFPLC